MSEVANATLMAIPTNELLEVHSKMPPPREMEMAQLSRFMGRAPALCFFGYRLWLGTNQAGWDEQFSDAIKSGWERASLSALDWLGASPATVEKTQTRLWIRGLHHDFPSIIDDEFGSIMHDNADTDTLAEAAEAEIEDEYPAFAALSMSMEAVLLERGWQMKEAATERLGASFAGLALKRQLQKSREVAELESQFQL